MSRVPAGPGRRWLGLLACLLLLLAAMTASLVAGARTLPLEAVWQWLMGAASGGHEALVMAARWPRMLLALLVGAALAIAGVLMQAVTRNPLADPGLLGVNAGASAAVVSAAWLFGVMPGQAFWVAWPGAMLAAGMVYFIGTGGRESQSVRLILAGAAINAVLFAYVQGVALLRQDVFDVYRFWAVGSLAGQSMPTVSTAWPYVLVGLLGAAALAGPLNVLALGDGLAHALGVHAGRSRLWGLGCVSMLAAAATAAVGPIAFLGLAVPHMARMWVGADLRWQMAYSVLLGPALLLAADVSARVARPPAEILTGVMVAFIGAPFLLWILRRTGGRSA